MNDYPKIYLLPGLGTDKRMFIPLKLQNLDFEVIDWEIPKPAESFKNYLSRLASGINTHKPFVLGGVSFGGMCAQSLAEILKPEKLILISTIRHPGQMPFLFRTGIQTGLYKWVSGNMIKGLAKIAMPIRTKAKFPDGKKLSTLIEDSDPVLLKWSFEKAAEWKPGNWEGPILQIHGEKDILFPLPQEKNVVVIKGAGHAAIIDNAKEIADRIRDFVRQ